MLGNIAALRQGSSAFRIDLINPLTIPSGGLPGAGGSSSGGSSGGGSGGGSSSGGSSGGNNGGFGGSSSGSGVGGRSNEGPIRAN